VPLPAPPTLDVIADATVYESAKIQTIPLTGISGDPTAQNPTMTVSALCSNPALLTNLKVNYSNPNDTGTLTFTPALNALGTATVTVTVNNGAFSNNITTQTFTVNVVVPPGGNQPPTLNPVANVTLLEDTAIQNVVLTGIGAGSSAEKKQILR